MKAGFGKSDITPKLGVELSGYGYYLGRKSESILDNLYARCIAFCNNGKKFLMINCDLLGVGESVLEALRELIFNEFGIDKNSVAVSAIHSHTSPAGKYYTGCGELDNDYIKELPELIFRSVRLAIDDLDEIEYFQNSQKEIEPISFNRSAGDAGYTDYFVRGIYITRKIKKPIAVASYNCHPVTLGNKTCTSADYPGRAAESLCFLGGRDVHGMFITGICGDIDPILNKTAWGSGTEKTISEYGQRIAEGFYNGLSETRQNAEDFSSAYICAPVPLEVFDEKKIKETADRIINVSTYEAFSKVVLIWKEHMLSLFEKSRVNYEKGVIILFRMGNFVFTGLNYEAFTYFGIAVRNQFPDLNIIMAGNTDDVKGYFTISEKLAEGGYEAYDSIFLYRKLPMAKNAAEVYLNEIKNGIYKI